VLLPLLLEKQKSSKSFDNQVELQSLGQTFSAFQLLDSQFDIYSKGTQDSAMKQEFIVRSSLRLLLFFSFRHFVGVFQLFKHTTFVLKTSHVLKILEVAIFFHL
jgi:hypothetical protein